MPERKYTSEGVPVELSGYSIPLSRETDMTIHNGLEVYAPRAFKATTMMVGNAESHIALSTGWSDPWQVVNADDVESFSIVAPLRTPMGINVLLWNLANSPQIGHLAIWAGSELDKTEKGTVARKYLDELWTNGVNDEGRVGNTEFKLLPELVENGGVDVVRKIISNVRLYNWSGADEGRLKELASSLEEHQPYMDPHKFPEFKIEVPDTWPSERTSVMVRESHLFDAWATLLNKISRYGRNTPLETGGAQVKELAFARVVIEAEDVNNFYIPSWIEGVSELKFTPESLDWYFQNRILPNPYMREIYPNVWKFVRGPKDPAYLYSELMFAFPRSKQADQVASWIQEKYGVSALYDFLKGSYEVTEDRMVTAEKLMADESVTDADKTGILLEIFIPPTNQIAKLVERLKTKPDDADKTVVLWDPAVHGMRDRSRPCLMAISILARDGKLDMETIWRSHDIAKGWPENLYGMLRLQNWIAEQTGYKAGHLIASSQSAHAYVADFSWVGKLLDARAASVKPSEVFLADKESDPRGNISITVVGKDIVLVLQDPKTSSPIKEFRGTYRQLLAQLKDMDLLSKPGHMIDVGSELQKAEISRLTGIPYIQDKPINHRRLSYSG